MKRSLQISLVLIGSLSLIGCSETVGHRKVFTSRSDCAAEYGPERCTPKPDKPGWYLGPEIYNNSHAYFGPHFYGGGFNSTHPGVSKSVGMEDVVRGGFGHFGGFHGFHIGG